MTRQAGRDGRTWLPVSAVDMLERTGQVLDLLPPARKARIGHEILVGGKGALGRPALGALVLPSAVQVPALGHVIDVGHHDLGQHLLMHGRVFDGHQRFDTPVEIARHPVGRRDEHPRLGAGHVMAVGEGDDTGVFQKTSDDALDADIVRQARHARAQTADAADHQIDRNPGLARPVQGVDDHRIDQRVQLGPDRRRLAGLGVLGLLGDQAQQFRLHRHRRERQLFQVFRHGVAGDEVEHLAGVAGEGRIAGEQRQVGIDLGRLRVIVAGAVVAVGAQRIALAPHHDRQLGVGFIFDESEHHMDARALQVAGPFHIGLLVEASLDLDQGGDVLAVVGGLDQCGHDRAVLRGPIKRLLDRQHVRVPSRLAQELDHDVESFERMVDQDVLFADGGEAVSAMVANPLGKPRFKWLELQVGTVGGDQLGQFVQPEHAVDQHHVLRLGVQAADDEAAQLLRHVAFQLDPDHRAHPPLLQPDLELANQVLGLFLDFQLAVADQAEYAAGVDQVAGKQVIQEQRQDPFQRDEPPVSAAWRGRWASAAAPRTGRPGLGSAPGRRAAGHPRRALASAPARRPDWE